MTTAADRLVTLAGTAGTAAALLLAIGTGATAGAALVNYSGLSSGTAAAHLLTDVATAIGGGPAMFIRPKIDIDKRLREDDTLLILLM